VKKTKSPAQHLPTILVHNRQRAIPIDRKKLQKFSADVLPACLALSAKGSSRFANLSELNVILVSDRQISDLHRRFLRIHGPTDVITFHHGEIFVSIETAKRQARLFRTSLVHELCLYITHGLLHLHGFDDEDPAGAAEMARAQEKLVNAFGI
jgi:probable rRNA maturation factor